MQAKTKLATITLPITAIKCLYTPKRGKKLVVELDINSLKKVNKPSTVDEMVAESRLEYYSGKLKGFTDTKKLMTHLES